MARGKPHVRPARLPDDLPEARLWRPELQISQADEPWPGEPYQPALFPINRMRPAPLLIGTIGAWLARPMPVVGEAERIGVVRVTKVTEAASAALPDIRGHAVQLGLAMAEAVLGRRPMTQLIRWAGDDVLRILAMYARVVPPPQSREKINIASVRLQVLSAQVVEAYVHTVSGSARLIMAFRLVGQQDRWLCTELDLLHPRVRHRRRGSD